MEIERLYDTDWLAKLIDESTRTCERQRQEGTGPEFVKVGKRVLYRPSAVEDWIQRNTFTSTAEAAAAKERDAAGGTRKSNPRLNPPLWGGQGEGLVIIRRLSLTLRR